MNDAMSVVDREVATYGGLPTDRFVLREFGIFPATARRWREEGWSGNPADLLIDRSPYCEPLVNLVGIDIPLYPEFEEGELYRKDGCVYYQTRAGAVERFAAGMTRWDEIMPEYVRNPVESREDWEDKIKPRLDPRTSGRYVHMNEALEGTARAVARGEALYEASAIGAFMYLRAMLGPQGVLLAFYDDPELIHDMMETWLHLLSEGLSRVQGHVPFFKFLIGEDISYKNGMLISPSMFNEFLKPYYTKLIDRLRNGQRQPMHLEVDTDGNVAEALPLYRSLGFDAMRPFEAAAGNDVVAVGRDHPGLVIAGGVDKRILAAGKAAIDREMARLLPAMFRRGGYLPSCDHSVPSNVSLADYLHFRRLLVEAAA